MWDWADRLATRTYRKWRLVPFADKVSVIVGIGSLLLGTMAVVLTVLALQMAERQEAIAVRQTAIAETQFAVLGGDPQQIDQHSRREVGRE